MRIYTDNSIEINNVQTGLKVSQDQNKTTVYSSTIKDGYIEYKMPSERYSLSHDQPASKIAGRSQFEADIVNLLEKINND